MAESYQNPDDVAIGRLRALDLFRGATVVAMILVNNPGDWGHLWWPLDHAEWHGWTPTDLIFPFFLFIVGTSAVLSTEKRLARGATRGALARHALVRGGTIVLVGWLMAWYPFGWDRLAHLRLPGVLPRIGVTYALGTLLLLSFGSRRAFRAAVAVLVLVLVHTGLLLGTGHALTREDNVQRAVDLAVLGGHLWKKDWDPEGIVSTLTALATFLTGALAGLLLVSAKPLKERIRLLALTGAAAAIAGQLLHPLLPVNKNLWTGSYVLLTSGLACVALALCLLATDVKGWTRGTGFFVTFGRNPLLVFVLSGLLAKTLGLIRLTAESGKAVPLHRVLFHGGFSWIANPALRSHAFALATIAFWWAVLKLCEKRGWYWKV